MFIGLLFADMLELVPKDGVSVVVDIFNIDILPDLIGMVLSMTPKYLSCIPAIEEFTLCKWSFNGVFLANFYFCRSLYLDKSDLSIADLKLLMIISCIPSTWDRDLVEFITWKDMPYQRQFEWLFWSFSAPPFPYGRNKIQYQLRSWRWNRWWIFYDEVL